MVPPNVNSFLASMNITSFDLCQIGNSQIFNPLILFFDQMDQKIIHPKILEIKENNLQPQNYGNH